MIHTHTNTYSYITVHMLYIDKHTITILGLYTYIYIHTYVSRDTYICIHTYIHTCIPTYLCIADAND